MPEQSTIFQCLVDCTCIPVSTLNRLSCASLFYWYIK
uniref:Uncharacterized protein n=1 Tax=Schistosoma curassoni TaxID=6186 RepID=A0A183JV13_9TREM